VHDFSKSEILRMGIAGSLTNVVCEILFHFVDTVNIRSKVYKESISTLNMLKQIVSKEGIYGLSKGISATFYGSIFCGFAYFAMYKNLKKVLREYLGDSHPYLIFFLAAVTAELFTMSIYYPFDLIKARLQTSNAIFKYKNLYHAFKKIVRKESIFSLYKGSGAFLVTYTMFVSLEFTIFEGMIDMFKKRSKMGSEGSEDFLAKFEPSYKQIIISAFLSGAIASSLTNAPQVITYKKQISPEAKVMDIVRQEKLKLLTKGLLARVYYNAFQAVVLFSMLSFVGKSFNVNLTDE